MRADRYAMLASSLPHLPPPFSARERPLTRIQLDRRLRLLEPADATTLRAIENVLRWTVLAPGTTDAEQAARGRQLVAEIAEPALREAVARRLESRTVVAALRRRRDGAGPPARDADLGYHRRADRIRRHWQDPALGLDATAPWVRAAERHLADGAAYDLERLLLRSAWRDLEELGRGQAFDVVAVALYVLKWDLMDRWMRYDAATARERFDAVVEDALAQYGPVQPAAAEARDGR
jgi:hypothetical protein